MIHIYKCFFHLFCQTFDKINEKIVKTIQANQNDAICIQNMNNILFEQNENWILKRASRLTKSSSLKDELVRWERSD